MTKRLFILGSTGTIGIKALEVVRRFKNQVSVSVLVANKSWKKILKQIEEFTPKKVILTDYESYTNLSKSVSKSKTKIEFGLEAVKEALENYKDDLILSAFSGTAGIMPTYWAVQNGSYVALANKESLVSAGSLIMPLAKKMKSNIIPVDSEHSAIFQLLAGKSKKELRKIILPASGGPFLNVPTSELEKISVNDALNHPVWRMGKKISIDSATLANKGLEVIEAHHLFGLPFEKIDVIIHPQCLIHGIIQMNDGAFFSHIGEPDMLHPITYAIFFPKRVTYNNVNMKSIMNELTFLDVDTEKFPMLKLAYEVGKAGKTYPAVYNVADELAVNAFLAGKIAFNEIHRIVARVVELHKPFEITDISFVPELEKETRFLINKIIKKEKSQL